MDGWMGGQLVETEQSFGLFRITQRWEARMVGQLTRFLSLSRKPDAEKASWASVCLFTVVDLGS